MLLLIHLCILQVGQLWTVVKDRLLSAVKHLDRQRLLDSLDPILCAAFQHCDSSIRDTSLSIWRSVFSEADGIKYSKHLK